MLVEIDPFTQPPTGPAARQHPWTTASASKNGGAHYDFIQHPELIR